MFPFNACAGHYSGLYSFGHNSPAPADGVFKPFTDSASLLVPIKKKMFSFGFGALFGRRHKWGCFSIFMAYFTWP